MERQILRRSLALLILFAAITLSPGNTRWSYILVLALGVLALVTPALSGRVLKKTPPLLYFLVAMIGLTAIQLLPIPTVLVGAIAPDVFETKQRSYELVGDPTPFAMVLSLDPHTTLSELAKLLGYAVAAFLFLHVAARKGGPRFLVRSLIWVGAVSAIVGIGHNIFGNHKLFGLLAVDRGEAQPFLSFLVNRNHFGLLMAISACASVAGFSGSRRKEHRLIFAATGLAFVGLALLCRSRGAIIGCGFGLLITSWGLSKQIKPKAFFKRFDKWLPRLLTFLCLALLVWSTAGTALQDEFAFQPLESELTDSDGRLEQYRQTIRLIGHHFGTGVGKGAYEAVISRFHPSASHSTFAYSESMPLQWLADWGVFGGAFVLLLAFFVVAKAFRAISLSPEHSGAAGGMAAIALTSCFDFAFEITGIGVATMLLAAVLSQPSLRKTTRPRTAHRLALSCLFLAYAALAASPIGATIREKRNSLSPAAIKELPSGRLLEKAKTLTLRHPADYFPRVVASSALSQLKKPTAVRYANHALWLHPTNGYAHHLAARLLLNVDRKNQACGEFKLAIAYAAEPSTLLEEIVSIYGDGPAALCIPTSYESPIAPTQLLLWKKHDKTASQLAKRNAELTPSNVKAPHLLYATAALRLGHHLEANEALDKISPSMQGVETARIRSEIFLRLGKRQEAINTLTEHLTGQTNNETAKLLNEIALLHIDGKEYSQAKQKLRGALRLTDISPKVLRQIRKNLATVERALGNHHKADWEEQRARSL